VSPRRRNTVPSSYPTADPEIPSSAAVRLGAARSRTRGARRVAHGMRRLDRSPARIAVAASRPSSPGLRDAGNAFRRLFHKRTLPSRSSRTRRRRSSRSRAAWRRLRPGGKSLAAPIAIVALRASFLGKHNVFAVVAKPHSEEIDVDRPITDCAAQRDHCRPEASCAAISGCTLSTATASASRRSPHEAPLLRSGLPRHADWLLSARW